MFDRVRVDGGELEYEVRGMGEPVLLIHGAILADAFIPLLAQPAFTDHYQVIHYHRRGFAGSSRHSGPCSITQQAADARALLDHLTVERAHVVGHSYGGTITLQLALDAPDRVASLALLEAAGIIAPSGEIFETDVFAPTAALFAQRDTTGAVDLFLRGVCGPQMRDVVEEALPPGAFDLAVSDIDTFFLTEAPAIGEWQFGRDQAARVEAPVLLVLGSESDSVLPEFSEVDALLAEWLPRAERATLPGATHALQMMNPAETAKLLTPFFARHSIAPPVS
jgi:pimeloyl-ACP methyl ester carboxylesterase